MPVQRERNLVSESQPLVPLLSILQKAAIGPCDNGSDCDVGRNPSPNAKPLVPLSIGLLKEIRAWLVSLEPTRDTGGVLMAPGGSRNDLQAHIHGQAKDAEADR